MTIKELRIPHPGPLLPRGLHRLFETVLRRHRAWMRSAPIRAAALRRRLDDADAARIAAERARLFAGVFRP
ncbi:hypothetical protein ACFVU2_00805 [Leifsonia sp. NPDC058194]|uniref:hypothetical protein n=1 Tax=Leifsonia sp. NPDC058194 TaxID=3346374 RepID=UPI0036DC8EF0